MADIRVGLIGIGGMGGCHYGNYKEVKGAKIVAVADVRVDMAKEKTKDDGVKVTFGLDESLKAEHELEEIEGAEYTVVHFGA